MRIRVYFYIERIDDSPIWETRDDLLKATIAQLFDINLIVLQCRYIADLQLEVKNKTTIKSFTISFRPSSLESPNFTNANLLSKASSSK